MIFQELDNGSLQFVGDFETLYQTDADPWGQSGGGPRAPYYRWSRNQLTSRITGHAGHGSRIDGLEIGCGHGHLAEMLRLSCGGRWAGMDISQTALQQAVERYPNIGFNHGDITELSGDGQFNVVIWSQILWYVAEKLEQAMVNTLSMLEDGGLFVLHQAFLAPGNQKYVMDGLDGFKGALRSLIYFDDLELLEARYRPDALAGLHDGLMIFRKKG